jgi:PAS domain S-box-containing protein
MENSSATISVIDFLSGGGQLGTMMRSFDFSKTALGSVTQWPASLRAATSICINSRYPMFIAWGKHRSMLYNDAYTAVLANKHPWALGRPAQQVWSEIWHILEPHWARVVDHGEATWAEDLLLVMNRSGYDEETYFTFSYSPIRGEGGSVEGMFCACQETTVKVIGERRLKTLRELAAQSTIAKRPQEAIDMAMKTFSSNPADVPFALLYLVDEDGSSAFVAGSSGIDKSDCGSHNLSLDRRKKGDWPIDSIIQNASVEISNTVDLEPPPAGCWEKPITRAILLPLKFSTHEKPSGVLVFGISPVREVDDSYRTFFEVAAGQTATAIANARAYQQERQRAEALAEIDRAKTLFFSNVSHEFRTPLTLMLGPVEDLLANSHTGLSPAAKGQLEIVNRNGIRLLRLVNTLLDFSRIEAGRVQAVFEPTDLAAFTADLVSVFRAATERAGLALSVDCPKLPEPVYVDRDMWEKIVLNLVSNAFKFTLEGEIEVTLRAVDGKAELCVRDTGVGIASEEMPRIFERFRRIQNVRSRTHEGSGIGLALVQELVKLHGGTVQAESRLNEGTTFYVTVPLGQDHLPNERIGAARNLSSTATGAAPYVEEALRWLPEPSDGDSPVELFIKHELLPVLSVQEPDEKRPWVLVADDNADMRHYLSRILSERYNVKSVPDGQAALLAAKERRPDLVLSDVMMPNLDGFGLVLKIRADDTLKTVPIILLSARAGEESRVEGLQHGADDYLIKPFSARELLARVAAHLDMARLRKEAEETLRESEKKYRELFESMIEAFCVIELIFDDKGKAMDFRFLETNPAFEKHATRPMLGKRIKEIVPEFEQFWLDQYGSVVLTGEPVELEHVVAGLGNQWFRTAAYRVEGEGSRKVAVVFVNITERKKAEQELLHLNETLEQQVAERTELAEARAKQLQVLSIELIEAEERERRRFAELLHDDLQQMIASARFQLQLINADSASGPVLEGIARILEESIEKSRRLSHELSPPIIHHGSVSSVIEWLAAQMKDQFGLKVHLEAQNIPKLKNSPIKIFIFRAVQELLFNIVKHSTVRIASVSIYYENSHLKVTVSDQGKGFDQEKLFHSKKNKGFGLISIRERATYIGGNFNFESKPGQGSRFFLTVPIQPAIDEGVQISETPFIAATQNTPSDAGIRVLFADDHKVMRQGLIRLISSQPDIQVVGEAANGKEAVELALKLHPTVILMDISMPEMDGIEATRRIKAESPEIRIIGLSMFEDGQSARNILEAGAEAFIAKTASASEVLRAIYGTE